MQPVLVTTKEALAEAIARLMQVPRVAADTEGNSMHAYQGRLCVVQLAVALPDRPAEETYLVDALAVGDLRPLGAVLGPDGPEKIFHDVGYDARLLATEGVALGRVVDTALHARLLGLRETGLASLLGARFGMTVSKAMQQHDWARRPLDARALAYLAGDVAQLGRLAAELESEVATLDIAAEVAEETDWSMAQALASASERVAPAWARVKGARGLSPVGRAALRELSAVRERWAERQDLPPGRVVPGASLLAMASSRPRTADEVRRLAGAGARMDGLAPELADAIARGEAAGDLPEDERHWLAVERSSADLSKRKVREVALSAWRAAEAALRGVDPQVVLPGHALSALAVRGALDEDALAEVDGLGPARRARYGAALVDTLRAVG